MFKKIPGSAVYSATIGGTIRNDDTGCEPVINNGKMSIDIYGKIHELTTKWLGLLAHYEIYLPEDFQEVLTQITFAEIKPQVTQSVAKAMPVYPTVLSIGDSRIIPGFSDYIINCFGIVREIATGRIIAPQKVSTNGYPYVFIYNPDKSTKMEIMVHRLVALAWVKNDDWFENPVVNHLDSDKTNYYHTNLEWTTHSKNQIHACDLGLVSSTIPCKVLDITNGEITAFKSIAQACRHFGITESRRSLIFESCKRGLLLNGQYEVKEYTDESEWYHVSYCEVGSVQHIILVHDGLTSVPYNIAKFRHTFKIWNVSGIESIVNKARLIYPNYSFDVKTLKPTEVSIQCLNLITNEIIEEPSMKQFSRRTGIGHGILHGIRRTGLQRKVGNLLIRLTSDDEWNKEFFKPPSNPKRILATNRIQSNQIEFESLRHCAKYFGVDRQTIKLRIERAKLIDDWLLEYIE